VADPWEIVYYKAADGRVPVFDYFIESCTVKLIAFMNAVLDSVAAAPPPAFSGGGHWEAMRGDMAGYFEAKAIGPSRHHHRVFCILENNDDNEEMKRRGLDDRKAIAVITGMWKPNATLFSDNDYEAVRALGDDHLAQRPRRIATPEDVDAFLERIAAKREQEEAKKKMKKRKR
jgi:hypothetical protein